MDIKLYRCFIASPSDVQIEREACDCVFSEINHDIGLKKGFRIESVKWEIDATPDFATDGQEVINTQLTPGGHDFFIGIFWKRFGNPTNRAESGTIEEFNQAYESWNKTGTPIIQIYFSDSPVSISEVSGEDLLKIENFKKEVATKGGLYAQYDGIEDFKKKLRSNIISKIFTSDSNLSVLNTHISKQLNNTLNNSLLLFNEQPVQWICRYLCKSEDISDSFNECLEQSITIDEIINTDDSYIIKAPPQFGLTCLAHKIRKEAWDKYEKPYMYLNLDNFKLRKLKQCLDSEKAFFDNENISCIIIDSWRVNRNEFRKLFENIESICPNVRLIVLQTEVDSIDNICNSPIQCNRNFISYNLLPLPKTDIRVAVKKYAQILKYDEDTILNKLVLDMEVLNLHRTPMNCWTLLKVAENSFDKNPVNRTQMLDLVLFAIFNLSEIPTYTAIPDTKDCEHVLGFFCEKLLREQTISFSKKMFKDEINGFCKSKLLEINVDILWDILCENKIIIESITREFRFKSSFWIYFFAAKRMGNNLEFKNYIFSEKRYSHYPEIIEFYTGITRDKTEVLEKLSEDLRVTRTMMVEKLGFPAGSFNPLKLLKWFPKPSDIEKMKAKLSNDVTQSSAPKHIKDQHADHTYNHLKPYNQDLHRFLEESSFLIFVYQLRSLSRALRNSDYSSAEVRLRVFAEIISAWNDIAKVLFMLAPILAQHRIASFGGYGFFLDRTFDGYHDANLLLAIIEATPHNVMNLVKDDISSDRIAPLINGYLKGSPSEISQHLIALYLISQRPAKWHDEIKRIIAKLDKNSFYLGNLATALSYFYQYDYMSKSDENSMKILIKSCIVKHERAIPSPTIANIAKVPDNVLPVRDNDKLRQL